MPKTTAAKKTLPRRNQRALLWTGLAVIIVLVSIVIVCTVIYGRANRGGLTCVQQELKPGEAFYDQPDTVKDGKHYKEICVNGG